MGGCQVVDLWKFYFPICKNVCEIFSSSHRLTMYNLKKDEDLNTLTQSERSQLWIPQIVFYNTDQKVVGD